MIPIILFLGLNAQEYLVFQIVQTILDYLFVFLILYAVLKKINPDAYTRRKALLTALGIEGVHVISSFTWYFLALYAMGGLLIELIFLFLVPFFVIYLLYTQNAENLNSDSMKTNNDPINQTPYLSTGKSWLLHALTVPPALLLSSFLTSIVFNLLGIQNHFIFS